MRFLQDIRYSLWFLPAIITAGAVVLAISAIELDSRIDVAALSPWPWLFGTSAEGARGMLAVAAGAMITLAALTFSITLLVLSLGAAQYTPRVIRTFMGSYRTQAVLGVFVGTFVYCLIVMRSIQGSTESMVPSAAVTIALLLSLAGAGLLMFFIHHMASSIQVSTIVSSVSADTLKTVDAIFPDPLERRNANDAVWRLGKTEHHEWFPVCSLRSGYLQTLDHDALLAFAKSYFVTARMEKSVGEFVTRGLTLISITTPPSGEMTRKLNSFYLIGHYRTVEQDVGAGIRQLADIALKAMSPAINDTTTAIMCIDYLSSIMIKLAPRRIAPNRQFSKGELLVIPKGPDFGDFLNEAFEQIRETAQGNVAIYVRLLEALETLARVTNDIARKKDIADQVRLVSDYARCNVQFPDQLKKIEMHRTEALKCCVLEATAL
ncbi:MAG: hypothetical protein A3I66_03710 [Burkholderiales bacterium RIFCSPLOWO2_02_FULL_57_36]|nr:MAG: hypothetical protein A3I66_03710 [Burkholderiales bacterium RIFCSPLOWO2_02_FULL_57_36]